ncbi:MULTISPECIES: chemotaxis protein CheW [Methanoculleus]|uniref:CheW protein n=2 Tax=Methanoculleus TaxID=45989 RepID=A3CS24_METMJ|nr:MULTISPECIES: chemotaxis protein CheW [Methanoculleus]ABN56174.1 putative CheW protein [Methanoculleus marisnigri JR1]UYU17642.1 chemotaxis protein CheW [Methanoculleus submarinus]
MTHLLSFTVEGLTCALPLAETRQVVGMVELQPETGKRRGGAGTMNLHGRAVPVYSLRRLLGLADRQPLPTDVLIIAHPTRECVALWADGVRGVQESPVELPPETDATSPPGMLLTEEEEIIIYDLGAFLAAEETAQHSLPGTAGTGEEAPPYDDGKGDEILAERARAFARPEEEAGGETPFSELLTFRLADREYAIKTQYIREVFIMHEITPVPGVPDFVAGICAVRGEIISVVDLRALFSIPKHGLTDLNRVIVLSDGTVTFGILADYITDIYIRPTDQFSPVEPETTPIEQRYLLGVTDESVLVLDAAAILGDPAMVVGQTRK